MRSDKRVEPTDKQAILGQILADVNARILAHYVHVHLQRSAFERKCKRSQHLSVDVLHEIVNARRVDISQED